MGASLKVGLHARLRTRWVAAGNSKLLNKL